MHQFAIGLMLTVALATAPPQAAEETPSPFAHMVFFALEDGSDVAVGELAAACTKYLSGHEGTLYFSVGARAKDKDRDVNDLEFDLSLHLVFESRAAQDAYQTHPRHLKFIEENQHRWTTVRVFDSYLQPGR